MSLLEFKNISKSFSGVEVLHNISFPIEKGKLIALIGENGAGKSTLMKILCGVLTDYQGAVILNGQKIKFKNPREAEKAGIAIIHQELNLVSDLSVAENIFLGHEPVNAFGLVDFKKIHAKAKMILAEFNFPYPVDTKVKHLSIGWQQMVEISKALNHKADIIVMDEPTSALSESEIKFLFKQIALLKSKGKTIIYISHRMKENFELADEAVILRDGAYIGIYKMGEIDQRFLVNKMAGKEIKIVSAMPNKKEAKQIICLKDVTVYKNKHKILSNISFDLKAGEVIGIAGLLGSGRTELLKFIYGAFGSDFEGKLEFKKSPYIPKSPSRSIKNKIIYLSEDRKTEGIFPELSNLKNSSVSTLKSLSKYGILRKKAEYNAVIAKTDELHVKMDSLQQHIQKLSGGNQQKILLSRVLLISPHVLLLDEPTRGIDVGAKHEFYKLIETLKNEGMAILLSSSEIQELLTISNKILVLSQGKQSALLDTHKTNPREILKYAFKETIQ